jgi:hypothetical protein
VRPRDPVADLGGIQIISSCTNHTDKFTVIGLDLKEPVTRCNRTRQALAVSFSLCLTSGVQNSRRHSRDVEMVDERNNTIHVIFRRWRQYQPFRLDPWFGFYPAHHPPFELFGSWRGEKRKRGARSIRTPRAVRSGPGLSPRSGYERIAIRRRPWLVRLQA